MIRLQHLVAFARGIAYDATLAGRTDLMVRHDSGNGILYLTVVLDKQAESKWVVDVEAEQGEQRYAMNLAAANPEIALETIMRQAPDWCKFTR